MIYRKKNKRVFDFSNDRHNGNMEDSNIEDDRLKHSNKKPYSSFPLNPHTKKTDK
jgi:hypothetical protein